MADRRMFAKTIIDSDAFLDMPQTSQNLYFHLSMRADDDGFINNPKRVQRMIGASDDDLKVLVAKCFIITFESGVVVIKHWCINNLIRYDRYKPTVYVEEWSRLIKKDNDTYSMIQKTVGIPSDNQSATNPQPNNNQSAPVMATQVRLGKVSIGKDRIVREDAPDGTPTLSKQFKKPTIEEVTEYCQSRNNSVDPEKFINYYSSNGWKVGKNSMKDWQAAIRTWEKSDFKASGAKDGGYQFNAKDFNL